MFLLFEGMNTHWLHGSLAGDLPALWARRRGPEVLLETDGFGQGKQQGGKGKMHFS